MVILVFANIYYELNNFLLDFAFSEHSNLKCALYADVHTAAEKTNFGGQQSERAPASLTFIQQSSGYSSKALVDVIDPPGYELVFGPTNGANNAPGVSFLPFGFYCVILINFASIWVLPSLTGTTSMLVPRNATLEKRIQTVVLANTSISGVPWSMEFPPLTLAAWFVTYFHINYVNPHKVFHVLSILS